MQHVIVIEPVRQRRERPPQRAGGAQVQGCAFHALDGAGGDEGLINGSVACPVHLEGVIGDGGALHGVTAASGACACKLS